MRERCQIVIHFVEKPIDSDATALDPECQENSVKNPSFFKFTTFFRTISYTVYIHRDLNLYFLRS